MELTIATATSKYVLSAEDLARYPESLLSTAYESQLAGNAGIVLDFDSFELPTNKFPNISREAVAGLVHGVYRDGKITAVLDTLITHVKYLQSMESASVYEVLHEEMSKLLDYFHLPAAVTSYLPPINTLNLQQRQLISFTYTAHDLEQAHMVVGAMLSYKPHRLAHQPRGAAAFLVTANTGDTVPAEAKVYVLLSPSKHFLATVVKECNQNQFNVSYEDVHLSDCSNVMRTRAAIMCETSDPAEAETVYVYSVAQNIKRGRGQFVAAKDKGLGQQLPRVFAAHGLKGCCCGVTSTYAHGPAPRRGSDCENFRDLPVWVLMW